MNDIPRNSIDYSDLIRQTMSSVNFDEGSETTASPIHIEADPFNDCLYLSEDSSVKSVGDFAADREISNIISLHDLGFRSDRKDTDLPARSVNPGFS